MCDIAMLPTAAHDQSGLVVVDNTSAKILGQCPLALGSDFSVASDSKGLGVGDGNK